ncbi:MAG: hypothetical protein AAB300_02240 [Nitrospirota bacterium]
MDLSFLIKKWRRSRMKYYFIFSLLVFSALVIVNLIFIRRYF